MTLSLYMDRGAKKWILPSNIDLCFWYWYWNIAFSLPNNLSCPLMIAHLNPTQTPRSNIYDVVESAILFELI
jgi:hypothetical protein